MVLEVFLYAASRMGSNSYHIYHLGSWPGPISQTPRELDHSHTDNHTESPEMGSDLSHMVLNCSFQSIAQEDAGQLLLWGQPGEQSSCWEETGEVARTLVGAH